MWEVLFHSRQQPQPPQSLGDPFPYPLVGFGQWESDLIRADPHQLHARLDGDGVDLTEQRVAEGDEGELEGAGFVGVKSPINQIATKDRPRCRAGREVRTSCRRA